MIDPLVEEEHRTVSDTGFSKGEEVKEIDTTQCIKNNTTTVWTRNNNYFVL